MILLNHVYIKLTVYSLRMALYTCTLTTAKLTTVKYYLTIYSVGIVS